MTPTLYDIAQAHAYAAQLAGRTVPAATIWTRTYYADYCDPDQCDAVLELLYNITLTADQSAMLTAILTGDRPEMTSDA